MAVLPSPAIPIASATEPLRLQPDRLYHDDWSCLPCVTVAGPQRTSPTVPKNMPTLQRVQHNTPAMRKNPSLSRNGGSDAEIMELNQQVEPSFLGPPLDSIWLDFHPQRRIEQRFVFLFSSWWSWSWLWTDWRRRETSTLANYGTLSWSARNQRAKTTPSSAR